MELQTTSILGLQVTKIKDRTVPFYSTGVTEHQAIKRNS